MNYTLFDGASRNSLLPLTFTRPVADIRIGILTIREKWERRLGLTTAILTQKYLEVKYPKVAFEEHIMINASFLPTKNLVQKIRTLSESQAIFKDNELIAYHCVNHNEQDFQSFERIEFDQVLLQIKNTWDIFSLNDLEIRSDFNLITEGKTSQPIPEGVQTINKENIFIEKGATVLFSSINASMGPVYIGKHAEIMEGCHLRGPLAICENSVLKMGAKVYGATTLGPHSKVGGEVSNSVFFGYSSKGHEGFMGNSVIGEWCNIGADTNSSNLKNNYAEVKVWNYQKNKFVKTGLQFCGLIMGDHSKCGINTMFNTGTVVGVSANIFGAGFPRNFVPSFSWGGTAGYSIYQLSKVFEVARVVMKRRGIALSKADEHILRHVFDETFKNGDNCD